MNKKPYKLIASYSQMEKWAKCPLRWKLRYIDKIKIEKPSLIPVFGTAMHETIQHYIETIFNTSVKAANEIDLYGLLKDRLVFNFKKESERFEIKFGNKDQFLELYEDGKAILDEFKKRRNELGYSPKSGQLLGIELHISKEYDGIEFDSYLDIVWHDKKLDKTYIDDIKTSKSGWKGYHKKDFFKKSQLPLYKQFYMEKYGIDDFDAVRCRYIILKRKIWEDSMYPIKRIQIFEPSSGKVTINKVNKVWNAYLESCFINGKYNVDGEFPAITGKGKYNNCSWCEFKDKYELCNAKNRIEEREKPII